MSAAPRQPRLRKVVSSTAKHKKYTAHFDDGSIVHFGGRGCMDFTLYWKRFGKDIALQKRRAYIARHTVNEPWTNPKSPGTLSRIILWEYPTVKEAVAKYHATLRRWSKHPSLKRQ